MSSDRSPAAKRCLERRDFGQLESQHVIFGEGQFTGAGAGLIDAVDLQYEHHALVVAALAVASGVIDTGLSSLTKTEEGRQGVLSMQAVRRLGQPDDVADVVAFLASDAARFITGTTIHVDGGAKL